MGKWMKRGVDLLKKRLLRENLFLNRLGKCFLNLEFLKDFFLKERLNFPLREERLNFRDFLDLNLLAIESAIHTNPFRV